MGFMAVGLPMQSIPNLPLGPNPLWLEVGVVEQAADWGACSFAFSFIVLQVFGSSFVAVFLHASDHGDAAGSTAELLTLCWVTTQILENSLCLASSCRMLGEEILGVSSPGGNQVGRKCTTC